MVGCILGKNFPVRANKLGKIKGFDTCLLLHRIHEGELKIVVDVPESGVVHTRKWTGDRWRTVKRSNYSPLTYANV